MRMERKKRGETLEGDDDVEKTGLDLEDAWKKDAAGFQPADRYSHSSKQVVLII